jgi:hypothetical protein
MSVMMCFPGSCKNKENNTRDQMEAKFPESLEPSAGLWILGSSGLLLPIQLLSVKKRSEFA